MSKRTLSGLVASIMMFASLANINPSANAATSKVNVWWPAAGAHMVGTQPFKAVLENVAVENYQMFWQVDGGQWVWMDSNYTDYPHKESSVDITGWSWKGMGPYRVNFIARSLNGTIIAQQAVDIYNDGQSAPSRSFVTPVPTTQPSTTPTPTKTPTPTPVPAIIVSTPTPTPSATLTPTVTSSGNPLAGANLYVNPYSDPKQWIKNNGTSPDVALMAKIADQPESQWFGDWNRDVYTDAKNTTAAVTATGATPVYVIYNIPHRDCGSYSAGGASNADSYRTWINNLISGIGGKKAVALLEPDALAGMDCLNAQDKAERVALLKETVTKLESKNIAVYIDAGNPNWIGADEMANRLKSAGVDQAHGFALNISNFYTTADNITFGTKVSSRVGNKHFLIDTSRNGSGPAADYQWCNPTGRSLGQKPTVNTGNSLVDAFLWVKGPGGSDGACGNGAPSAGIFWPSYALDLARRTTW